jgi:hypothetical protein
MTVYEATKDDFKKIVEFIAKQDTNNLLIRCFSEGQGKTQTKYFEELLATEQGLKIFVCEDEKGQIRLAFWRQRRGKDFNIKEPELVTQARLVMDVEDYRKDNTAYFNEFIKWISKYEYETYGITRAIHWVEEKTIVFLQQAYGDALKILQKREETIFGTLWKVEIDLAAYLNLKQR